MNLVGQPPPERAARRPRWLGHLLPTGTSIALVLGSVGCWTGEQVAAETLPAYFTAVQNSDYDRLYCLSAGAGEAEELGATPAERRANFAEFARGEIAGYLEQRDEGFVELTGHGIRAVKLFVLGKGTYYTAEPGFPDSDGTLKIRTLLRFGYNRMNLSALSPGTTFYVDGTPLGTVIATRVPRYPTEVTEQVLDSVVLEWTLQRQEPPEGCRDRWAIASVRPLEESVTETRVTWIF